MELIINFITDYSIEITIGLILGMLIILIITIIQGIYIRKVRDRYNAFVRGMKGIDIEGLFIQQDRDIKDIKRDINLFEKHITNLETKLSFAIHKIGFIRYNAFTGVGSELSFSVAFMDDFQNGFIITSIYGRDNSVCYGKPLVEGKSKIPLSAEELIAIERALKGNSLETSY